MTYSNPVASLQGHELLKLLLAIEPVVVMNAALCEHHLKHCPPSRQLTSECAKVATLSHLQRACLYHFHAVADFAPSAHGSSAGCKARAGIG